MSKFSDDLEVKLLNLVLRGVSYTPPTSIYIGLFTSDPSDTLGSPTGEVLASGSWEDYVRVDAAAGAAIADGWQTPGTNNGTTSNAKVITFLANDGSASVTIHGIGIFDGSGVNANLLFHATLATDKTLLTGDVLSFGVGSITVTLD
jgi:hypothetical protein